MSCCPRRCFTHFRMLPASLDTCGTACFVTQFARGILELMVVSTKHIFCCSYYTLAMYGRSCCSLPGRILPAAERVFLPPRGLKQSETGTCRSGSSQYLVTISKFHDFRFLLQKLFISSTLHLCLKHSEIFDHDDPCHGFSWRISTRNTIHGPPTACPVISLCST